MEVGGRDKSKGGGGGITIHPYNIFKEGGRGGA